MKLVFLVELEISKSMLFKSDEDTSAWAKYELESACSAMAESSSKVTRLDGPPTVAADAFLSLAKVRAPLDNDTFHPVGSRAPKPKEHPAELMEIPGGTLERQQEFEIDGRRMTLEQWMDFIKSTLAQQRPRQRYAVCGNCQARYPITDDAAENHHRAMRHKETCPKADQAAIDRARLIAEFNAQPNIMAQREAFEQSQRDQLERRSFYDELNRAIYTYRPGFWERFWLWITRS
jgi:hypothetical protein